MKAKLLLMLAVLALASPLMAQDGGGVTAITDGAARTTFIQKAVQPDERSGKRNLPEATAGKQKILEGCDPSFSPVTIPALAHVTGRCIV